MSGIRTAITGVSGFLPPDIMTNQDLEKLVETSDEWITTRTGIKERRILTGERQGVSKMLSPAVAELLETTNTKPEEVDIVVTATITPDYIFPDTSALICHDLGLKNAWGYDLRAACSGFLFGLTSAAQFVKSGTYKKVVFAAGDKMSSILNYKDRTTCIIFGDGGAAVMLEPTTSPYGIIDYVHYNDASNIDILIMKGGGSVYPATHESVDQDLHYIFQDGKPVFKAAVKGMVGAIKTLMKRNNLATEDIDWVIPHQANQRIINTVADYLNVPHEKVTSNIHKYGNTTAATIPLCMWEWQDKFKEGDNIILTAFGGGFTWGATYLKWGH